MKKLSLDADALVVETFETAAIEEFRGTVQGHATLGTCAKTNCTQCITFCQQTCGTDIC